MLERTLFDVLRVIDMWRVRVNDRRESLAVLFRSLHTNDVLKKKRELLTTLLMTVTNALRG